MITEYETLNSALENGHINASSNYYNYILYLLVAVVLIIILLNLNFSNQQTGGGYSKIPFIIFILSVIIIVNAYLKN